MQTNTTDKKTTSKKHCDRVMSALEIHQTPNAILQSGAQKFAVRSQRKANLVYSVGVKNETPYCACRDYELHGQPCKHIFATVGYAATAAILSFRWANDVEELEIAASLHAEALKALPEIFRSVARAEYKAAYERLNASAALAA